MDKCKSPLYSIVYVITEHSDNLYKTVQNLKILSVDQPAGSDDGEMIDVSLSDVDNLCGCSVGTEAV